MPRSLRCSFSMLCCLLAASALATEAETPVSVADGTAWEGAIGAIVSVDALGRGGGDVGDIGLAWEQAVASATTLTLGTGLSLAGDRYLQTYYGVNEAQALRSGYAVYTPKAGLRDVSAYANLRHDLGEDWIVLGGASLTRLLGPAADSPLTTRRSGWGLNAGIARRF